MKTIRELTAEIRAINIEKGWRPAEGGPGANTFGDYLALLHSEVSEMLEAYRDHRLEDATIATVGKPEGVGSEAADVLIRLLDMADVFGMTVMDGDFQLADISPLNRPIRRLESFGDHISWLHRHISDAEAAWGDYSRNNLMTMALRALVAVCEHYGIDLNAEVERKIAYNRTRGFQHGGRTVADAPA